MDYTFKTTFWTDFQIAEHFGISAVKDTYKRAFKEWKNDLVYVTELCLVLNWRSWECSRMGKDELTDLYINLYYEVRDWCMNNLKGDDFNYFWSVID